MNPITFMGTELAVKSGQSIADTDTISIYVHLGLERAKSLSSVSATRAAHLRVIDTLIDTMCDDMLQLHWRKMCHKWVKKLMPLLFELLEQDQYWQRVHDIKLLHQYFIKDKADILRVKI